jgi:hypothetical protein
MKALFCVIALFQIVSFYIAPDVLSQTVEYDTDRPGMNYKNFDVSADPNICRRACAIDPQCKAFTYVKPGIQGPNARCWLKNGVPASKQSTCCISGVKKTQTETPEIKTVPVQPKYKVISPAINLESDTDRPGMDYRNFDLSSADANLCARACSDDPRCKAFTYVKPGIQGPNARCWLKSGVPASVKSPCCISGVKPSGEAAPAIGPTPSKENATPLPLPGPQSSLKKTTDPKAVERQNHIKQFQQNWRATVDKVLGDVKSQMASMQENEFQKSIQQLNLRFKQDSAKGQTAGFTPQYIKNITVKQKAVIKPNTKVNTAALMKPPKIIGLVSLGATEADRKQNEIRSRSFIEISGSNLGSCDNNCGVRIEYYGKPLEGEAFVKNAPVPTYTKDLMPVGTWAKCWGDSNILAQVPEITEFPISTTAKVIVWKGGQQSFAIPYTVTLFPDVPGVNYIVTVPEYGDGKNTNAIISGGAFLIYGSDFGDKPGQVYLEFTSPIGNIPSIDLTPSSTWTNHLINVTVPKIPGKYVFQTAKLHIRKGNASATTMLPVRFGPRMIVHWVSGYTFFDINYGKEHRPATVEKQGPILKVTHDPDCGITKGNLQGEDGIDWFFKNPKKLPGEAEFMQAIIQPMDPDFINDWDNWLLVKITDIAKACMSGPYKCLWEIAKLVIPKWFDSKAGSYVVQVNDFTKQNIPLYSVNWENACYGPYDGVPNIYTATFLIYAPEWANYE